MDYGLGLLVDVALPSLGGVAVAGQLAHEVPGTRVAMLFARYDEEQALHALRAGAVGYVSKEVEPHELCEVVRRLRQGEAAIPATLARRAIECLREIPDTGWARYAAG